MAAVCGQRGAWGNRSPAGVGQGVGPEGLNLWAEALLDLGFGGRAECRRWGRGWERRLRGRGGGRGWGE